jgi:hypothetical protein
MEGRIPDALQVTLISLQRYGVGWPLRGYPSMLFMLGQQDQGWAAFNELRGRTKEFSVWRAAAVGLRTSNTDADGITKWLATIYPADKAPRAAGAGESGFNIAFQTLAVDRPLDSLPKISEIIRNTMYPLTGDPSTIERNQRSRDNKLNVNTLDDVAFIYASSRRGEHQVAFERFERAEKPGSIFTSDQAYYPILPYIAYSAARVNKNNEFAAFLAKWQDMYKHEFEPKYFSAFDANLSKGVMAALAGSHDEAKQFLLLARANMPEPEQRVLPPEYVYADICEILGRDTGRREYIELGLDWARSFQRYEPWAAWAYAFEAKHTTKPEDRVRALGLALQLDPRSERIAGFDEKSKQEARDRFKASDPFGLRRKEQAVQKQQGI